MHAFWFVCAGHSAHMAWEKTELLSSALRYGDIDFLHYAWGALMQNQFKPHPTALFNGQPVLQYYYLHGARVPQDA